MCSDADAVRLCALCATLESAWSSSESLSSEDALGERGADRGCGYDRARARPLTRPSPTAAGCICIDEGIRSVIVCGWIGPAFGSAPYTSGFESGFESDEERESRVREETDAVEGAEKD